MAKNISCVKYKLGKYTLSDKFEGQCRPNDGIVACDYKRQKNDSPGSWGHVEAREGRSFFAFFISQKTVDWSLKIFRLSSYSTPQVTGAKIWLPLKGSLYRKQRRWPLTRIRLIDLEDNILRKKKGGDRNWTIWF